MEKDAVQAKPLNSESKPGTDVDRTIIAELIDRVKRLCEAIERRDAPRTASCKFLTNAEAAEMLGIQPGTLATWRWKRKGPKVSPSGNKIRYRVADIEKWIDANSAEFKREV